MKVCVKSVTMRSQSILHNLTGPKHTSEELMMRNTTKVQALEQFRYNWKVLTKQQPKWKGDVIAKRESWNDFVDALNKEGYISDNQAMRWDNPF